MNINRRCGDNCKKAIRAFKTDLSSSNSQLNEAFDAGSNCTSCTDNFVSCEESSTPSRQTSHILAGRLVSEAKQNISIGVVQSFTDSTIVAGQLENLKKDDTFDEVTTILNQLVSLPLSNESNESNDVAGMVDSTTTYTSGDIPKSLNIASNALEKQQAIVDRYNDLIHDISTSVCHMCKTKLQTKIQTIGRDANYNVQQSVHDKCIEGGQTSKRVPLTIKNLREHTDISTSQYLKHQIVPDKQYCLSPRNKPASSKILLKNIGGNSTKLNILKNTNYVDRLTTLLEESHNERQQGQLDKNTKFIQDESTPQWAPSFNECSIMNNQSKSRTCVNNPTEGRSSKMSSSKTSKTIQNKKKHINVEDSPISSRLTSTNSRKDDSFLYLEHLCKVCDNSVAKENTSTEVKHNSSSSSSTALDLICDVQMASLDNEKSLDLHTKLLRELIATKKLCRDLIDTHPQGISDPRLRRTRQSLDNFLKVLTQEERMVSPNKKKIERSLTVSGNNVSRVINTSPIKPVSSLRKLFSPKLSTFSPSTTSSSSVRRSVKSPIKNVPLHLKSSPKNVTQYSSKKLPSSKSRSAANISTPSRKCLPTVMISKNTFAHEEGYFVKCGSTSSAPKIFVTPSKNTGSNKGFKLRPRKYFADVL